jgi:hypothetical protein
LADEQCGRHILQLLVDLLAEGALFQPSIPQDEPVAGPIEDLQPVPAPVEDEQISDEQVLRENALDQRTLFSCRPVPASAGRGPRG